MVADATALGGGALLEVDPLTGAESVISSNQLPVNASHQLFDQPFTLALDQAGNILVANTGNLGGSCSGGCGGVIEVDPSTGAESVLSSNAMPINASSQYFYQPTGIAVSPQGRIYVSDWEGCSGCGEVIEVDPATGKETLISANALPVNSSSQYFTYIQGLAVDQAGEVLAADPLAFGGSGGVIAVDPNTGKETELSANSMAVNASSQYFHSPSQLAIDHAGKILVADWCPATSSCGGVIEVDPDTGKEAELSTNAMPVNAHSQYFAEPTAVAVDNAGRIIAVQEAGLGGSCTHGCGGLLYVDPATGQESELAANSLAVNGLSEFFAEPFDVAVVGAPVWGPEGSAESSAGGPAVPGNPPSRPPPPSSAPSHRTPPLISRLAQTHPRWHERSARSGNGTVFSFTLSEPARVELTFARRRRGRALHGACAARSAHARRHPSCSYTTPAGSLTIAAHAGRNRLAFAGRLARGRTLQSGGYLLSASAENAEGTSAAGRTLLFTIVR